MRLRGGTCRSSEGFRTGRGGCPLRGVRPSAGFSSTRPRGRGSWGRLARPPSARAFGQLCAVATVGRVCGGMGRQCIPCLGRCAVGGRGLGARLVRFHGAGAHGKWVLAEVGKLIYLRGAVE